MTKNLFGTFVYYDAEYDFVVTLSMTVTMLSMTRDTERDFVVTLSMTLLQC